MRVLVVACVTIPTASADEPVFSPDSPFDRVATGFTFTEGPALGSDHSLYFSDIPAGKIWRIAPDGQASEFLTPPGPTNGLAFDHQGRLVMCVTKGDRKGIARREADGAVRFLVDNYAGKPFIGPNDLAIDAEGRIYFTDPDYTTPDDPKPEIEPAVYCLKPPAEE
jgi:gluconolactonase